MPDFRTMKEQADRFVRTRTLLYGPIKTRKTTWALKAMECGFNVIHLDMEEGAQVHKFIDDKHKEKQFKWIPLANQADNFVAAIFMALLCRGKPFCWDEEARLQRTMLAQCKPEHGHWWIDPSKLTLNDVIVPDSLSVWSDTIIMKVALETGVDLSETHDNKPDREHFYNYMFNHMTWAINHLVVIPCHIILIGHADQYDKYAPKKNVNDKSQDLLWTRTQPKATSKSFAMTVGGKFDNVLFTRMVGDGQGGNLKISTKPDANRDGGSRVLEPKEWAWDELQFKQVAQAAGLSVPREVQECEAFKYYTPGEPVLELQPRSIPKRTSEQIATQAEASQPTPLTPPTQGKITFAGKFGKKL